MQAPKSICRIGTYPYIVYSTYIFTPTLLMVQGPCHWATCRAWAAAGVTQADTVAGVWRVTATVTSTQLTQRWDPGPTVAARGTAAAARASLSLPQSRRSWADSDGQVTLAVTGVTARVRRPA